MRVLYRILLLLTLLTWAPLPTLGADASLSQQLGLHTGAEIYQGACAACHGPIGHGTPQTTAGFEQTDSFPHWADTSSRRRFLPQG